MTKNNLEEDGIVKFESLTSQELIKILDLTIKKDNENKLITFLVHLSAYTEDSQLNLSFNAPSSTGKSYIPLQISQLFPREDVIKMGGCSPAALYHECGSYYDEESNTIIVDLSRKIMIFFDQPHSELLVRIRPLLSHDEKEIQYKITDKNKQGGNRTKTVILVGYPVVIFCTAGLKIDEQEITRFILLSPEMNQEKIVQGIQEKILKESDQTAHQNLLDCCPERKLLKERIIAIRNEHITEIKIDSPKFIEIEFFKRYQKHCSKHQRDIAKIICLVKAFALLNLWDREKDGSILVANKDDINEAFKVWDKISKSEDLGIPPHILDTYHKVIKTLWQTKLNNNPKNSKGLTKQEIMMKYFQVFGNAMPEWKIRQEIFPMLESSGLIIQKSDINDKRNKLVYPIK